MLEIERKYVIEKDKIKLNKYGDFNKVGIIQWYLKIKENEGIRIRVELRKEGSGYKLLWSKNWKRYTENPQIREEKEEKIENIEFEILKDSPLVAKIRRKKNLRKFEIVIDELIDFNGNLDYKIKDHKDIYLVEIESKENVDKKEMEKALSEYFDLRYLKDVTETKKYDNHKIAGYLKKNMEIPELIEYIKEYI